MTLRIQALLVAAATLLITGTASAVPTIKLIWRQNSLPTIGTPDVSLNSVVNADIVLIGDDPAVNGVFISIEFDNVGLEVRGSTELAVVKLPGMANTMSPLGLGTALNQAAGLVTNFDQATLSAVACGLGCDRTLGSVKFTVTSLATDSGAIASLQNTGVDAITSVGISTPVPANFEGATVVPEPGSAAAGAVALATLLGLRRRRA